MSKHHADLLLEIEAFLAREAMSEITFGRQAMGDPHFVRDIRGTRRCWPETIDRARTFMSGYLSKAGDCDHVDINIGSAGAASPGMLDGDSPCAIAEQEAVA